MADATDYIDMRPLIIKPPYQYVACGHACLNAPPMIQNEKNHIEQNIDPINTNDGVTIVESPCKVPQCAKEWRERALLLLPQGIVRVVRKRKSSTTRPSNSQSLSAFNGATQDVQCWLVPPTDQEPRKELRRTKRDTRLSKKNPVKVIVEAQNTIYPTFMKTIGVDALDVLLGQSKSVKKL
jgi:hypothetical protein